MFRSPQLRRDLSGLSVNVGESQITQSLKSERPRCHIETLEKLGICYRIMLVLLLFMYLLVVD